MEWWVTKGDRKPVGPVSTELLLQGIGAGKVPKDALICEVGGTTWKAITDVAPFSAALLELSARPRVDSIEQGTIVDPPTDEGFLSRIDDTSEHTTVDQALRQSEPPPRPWLDTFSDSEEKTVVDLVPLRPSDPPPKS